MTPLPMDAGVWPPSADAGRPTGVADAGGPGPRDVGADAGPPGHGDAGGDAGAPGPDSARADAGTAAPGDAGADGGTAPSPLADVVVFVDQYGPGVSFVAFVDQAGTVSRDDSAAGRFGANASLKVHVPAQGYVGGAFTTTPGRDLSRFDAVTFWAKADHPVTLDVVGLGNDATALLSYAAEVHDIALTTSWKQFTVPIPDAAKATAVPGLFHVAQGASGAAYDLWLADVRYELLGPAVVSSPRPRFTSQSIALAEGATAQVAGMAAVFAVSGADVEVTATPSWRYFTFTSSAPGVTAVDEGGRVTALASSPTPAVVTAKLGSVDVQGTLTVTVSPAKAPWKLMWSDEFSGPQGQSPAASSWTFDVGGDGWGNQQLEFDTARPENVSLDGEGHLAITARQESYGGRAYTSGRLKTEGLQAWTSGRFESRIKVPVGQGLWPAFWMLGSNISSVGWPYCGEIDVMEIRGSAPRVVWGSLHGPGYSGGAPISASHTAPAGLDQDFHVYAVEWEDQHIAFELDGTVYKEVTPQDLPPGTTWVFDHPFFILLNLAVGGAFGGDPNAETVFPQSMLVDYVRVYQRQK